MIKIFLWTPFGTTYILKECECNSTLSGRIYNYNKGYSQAEQQCDKGRPSVAFSHVADINIQTKCKLI